MRWLETVTGILKRRARGDRMTARVDESTDELSPHLALGRLGERMAARFLERKGYRLVAANFRLAVGRNTRGQVIHNEIDIVAYEGETLCFVEVKTRQSDSFALPESNVDLRKQRQITRAARVYRRTFNLTNALFRYDVVSVLLPPAQGDGSVVPPQLRLLRGFWTEERFRKRSWFGSETNY